METETVNSGLTDSEIFQEFQAVLDEMTDIPKVTSSDAKRILLAHSIDKVMNLGNIAISQIKQLKDEVKTLNEKFLKSQEHLKKEGKNRSYVVVILIKSLKMDANNKPHMYYKQIYDGIQAKSEDHLLANCYEKYGRNIYVLPIRCKDTVTGIQLFDNTPLIDEFLKNVLVPYVELDEVDRENLAKCGTLTPAEIPETDADVEELAKQFDKEDGAEEDKECHTEEHQEETDNDSSLPLLSENIATEEFVAAGLLPPQESPYLDKQLDPESDPVSGK